MKKVKALFGICLALFLMSCQSINQAVQEPNVSLNSVDIAQITLSGVNLIARIDVENTNRFPVPLPVVDWELFVNAVSFTQGVVREEGTIRGLETISLDVPINFTFEGLFRSFASLMDAREVAYNIALGISFPIPVIENFVHNLDFYGVLPLPRLPILSNASVSIAGIDYSSIVLASTVNVENPNSFPIAFPEIDLDFGLGGLSLINDRSQNPGMMIAAGAVAATNMNMNISYADIFAIVGSAARNEIESILSVATVLPVAFASEERSVLDIPVTIPIVQKPEISFQGITRRSLGRTMEFVLNWEVDNRNNFDFEIEAFDYSFLVNNRSWAEGRALNPPSIRAGSRTVIPVDISISTHSIVVEIVDIINRGAMVNYTATGNINFSSGLPGLDIPEFPFNFTGATRIR